MTLEIGLPRGSCVQWVQKEPCTRGLCKEVNGAELQLSFWRQEWPFVIYPPRAGIFFWFAQRSFTVLSAPCLPGLGFISVANSDQLVGTAWIPVWCKIYMGSGGSRQWHVFVDSESWTFNSLECRYKYLFWSVWECRLKNQSEILAFYLPVLWPCATSLISLNFLIYKMEIMIIFASWNYCKN